MKTYQIFIFVSLISTLILLGGDLVDFSKTNTVYGREIQGFGEGVVICPDQTSADAFIIFNTQTKGFVIAVNSTDIVKIANVTELNTTSKAAASGIKHGSLSPDGGLPLRIFTIRGTELFDSICNTEVPVEVTITGVCEEIFINYRAPNNLQHGFFTGPVICSR